MSSIRPSNVTIISSRKAGDVTTTMIKNKQSSNNFNANRKSINLEN